MGPLVLASGNEHKLRELQSALAGWQLELLGRRDFPPEDGETYYDNALAKARFGRTVARADSWVLGEDSGLEIDALGGAPGVRSSRWVPDGHIEHVLTELHGVEREGRGAHYVCELVALSPDGGELRGTGVLEGRIAEQPSGSEGFGYDPIFIPEGQTNTVAVLGNGWKAENSHRARAARALVASLSQPT